MTARQMFIACRRCAAAALLFALAGCAQIPATELTQYRQAFDQTKDVSGQVLLDFDQALKAAEANRNQAAGAPPLAPYPTEWSKVNRARASGGRNDIETRRRAWEVVSDIQLAADVDQPPPSAHVLRSMQRGFRLTPS